MPKYAVRTQAGRSYRIPGIDTPLTSVTTALGVINKPALVNWAARMAAQKAIEDENMWHAILENEGEKEAVKYIASASSSYSNDRRTLGSIVHWLAETYENDRYTEEEVASKVDWFLEKVKDPDLVREEAEQMFGQYRLFVAERKPRFILREHTVFNATRGYAGTLDMVAELDESAFVGDIKTGGIYPEQVIPQLAAYRYSEFYLEKDTDKAIEMPTVDGGFVLNINTDSYEVQEYVCGEGSYRAFLAALTLYRWTKMSLDLLKVV